MVEAFIGRKEAAKFLAMSLPRFDYWIKSGKLPEKLIYNKGGSLKFLPSELQEFMKNV